VYTAIVRGIGLWATQEERDRLGILGWRCLNPYVLGAAGELFLGKDQDIRSQRKEPKKRKKVGGGRWPQEPVSALVNAPCWNPACHGGDKWW